MKKKKKVEVCLSKKDILPPPQQVLMERILCEVFISLNLLSCVKLSFLLFPFQFIPPIISLSKWCSFIHPAFLEEHDQYPQRVKAQNPQRAKD